MPEQHESTKHKTRGVRVTLMGAGVSSHFRQRIKQAYLAAGGKFKHLDEALRELLAEAIFKVENDLEHRQPSHPMVTSMRKARNMLYDALRWNEYAKNLPRELGKN